jgi:hypothetical protein
MILEDVNDRQGTKAPSKWPFLCIPLPQVEQPWDVLPSSRANETAFECPPESRFRFRARSVIDVEFTRCSFYSTSILPLFYLYLASI